MSTQPNALATQAGIPPPTPPDKIVAVPGLGTVSFPGTMSDDDVSGAIRQHLASQPGAYQTGPGAPIQNSTPNALVDDAGVLEAPEGGDTEGPSGDSGTSPGFADQHPYLANAAGLLEALGNVPSTIGMVKGAGHTAYGLANLVNEGLSRLPYVRKYAPAQQPTPDVLQPQGPAEKTGYLAEQMGEYYLPSEGLTAAAELSPLAETAEKTPGLIAEMAREAAGTGAVSAAQGQGFTSGAAYGAAVPAASAVLTPAAEALARRAPGLVNSLIKPSKALKRFTDPGAAVVNEGIVATSLPDLAEQLSDKVAQYGDLINDATSSPSVSGNTQDARPLVEGPINDMIQKVASGAQEGGQALIDRLNELMDQLTKSRALDEDGKLIITGEKDLTLNPENLNAMKRTLGGAYGKTGLPYDAPVNQVKRQIYQNLKGAVAQAVPGVSDLNARETGLIAAMKAAENRAGIIENAAPISLADIGAAGVAGVPGLAAKRAVMGTLGTTARAQLYHNAPGYVDPTLRLLRAFLASGSLKKSSTMFDEGDGQ